MKNTSVFQIVVLAVFILIAIVGVAIFAGFGGSNKNAVPKATIWGTVPGGVVNEVVRNVNVKSTVIEVTYIQKDPETFENDFINALAEGKGPDVVLLNDDLLYKERNKLQPIPFKTYPERDFLNTFIDGAKLFDTKDGLLGIPVSIDPIVMYWNKNIFAGAGVPRAPITWAEVSTIGPAIIKKTDTSTITTSLIPFGEVSNVHNAKNILATLLFQAGNPIAEKDTATGDIHSVIDAADRTDTTSSKTPAESVVDFYTSFANPSKALYTWNLSLPDSLDYFLAGKLALYFGLASELTAIQNKNPNLNYDVALVPQNVAGSASSVPVTYGKMTALAVVKQTKNVAGAVGVISNLTTADSITQWSTLLSLPPVRRDLLLEQPKDAYMAVFNKAAIQSQSWYDPDPEATDKIFQDMIESVTTGKREISDSITDARQKLERLYKK